jgi:hypothetical protein
MKWWLPLAAAWSASLFAQTVDFPCVPDYRADPSYIKISESSGGQIFLFHKGEMGTSPVTGQVLAHMSDPTVLRASGTLAAGTREFAVPIDPSVTSLAASVFAECVKVASIVSPSGREAAGEKFKSGRIAMAAQPEPGIWKVRVAGTGYFTVAVQASTSLKFTPRVQEPNRAAGFLPENLTRAEIKILSRDGGEISTVPLVSDQADYNVEFPKPTSSYRIAIEATDAQGFRIRRMHSALIEP